MESLTALPVDEFLSRTADRTPTPGGGAVTGLTGALACAQARMVVAYSITHKTEDATRAALSALGERLQTCERLFRELMTEDADAYQAMADTARPARAPDASPDAKRIHQSAVTVAASIPTQMAAVAADVLHELDTCKTRLSRFLLSDLGIAATLAHAVTHCAHLTVQANLPILADADARQKLASDIMAITTHAAAHHEAIHAFVQSARSL